MTSAPRSASNTEANGAATMLPASITRTPVNGFDLLGVAKAN